MPPLNHHASSDFWSAYKALPHEVQRRTDKQFELLAADPQHPSLRFMKIGERHGQEIYSARVTLTVRALAVNQPDSFLWFWIGDHSTYDALIG